MGAEKSGVSASRILGEVAAAHGDDVFGVWQTCFFGPFFQERAECFALVILLGKEADALWGSFRLTAVLVGCSAISHGANLEGDRMHPEASKGGHVA